MMMSSSLYYRLLIVNMKMWEKMFLKSNMQNLEDRKVRGHMNNTNIDCYYGDVVLLGKRVFKKPVKFLIKFVPTETSGDPGSGVDDSSSTNDGKTFIVTFVQTSGKRREGGREGREKGERGRE